MEKRIIYPTPEGGVAILIPTGELPLDEVARKDVPAGLPYKFVDASDIPSDRTFRDAWEADLTNADGTGIGSHVWFIEQYTREIEEIKAETPPAAPDPILAKSINEIDFPEGITINERDRLYAEYLKSVDAENAAQEERHAAAVSSWQDNNAHRIAELEKKISIQKQEIAA